MPSVELDAVEEIVARCGRERHSLIPILQGLQSHYGYVPEEALQAVCAMTEITPAAAAGVSTFYDMFRQRPTGRTLVRVCHGTACHVAGAEQVEEALRREWRLPPDSDTDSAGDYTIERVACLGCCTLAPVISAAGVVHGHVTAENAAATALATHNGAASLGALPVHLLSGEKSQVRVGLGSCCMAKGSDRLFQALQESARRAGAPVTIKPVGCVGMCHRTPMIEVVAADSASAFYTELTPASAPELIQRHFPTGGLARRAKAGWDRLVDGLILPEAASERSVARHVLHREDASERAFFEKQIHIATEHFGQLDPLGLDEYLSRDGFAALRLCLRLGRDEIVATVEKSGLRGRGGAGFPTGSKWRAARAQSSAVKYVICNGDEGDPGAFMDRMILESFPFRVIEGLAIAAVAVGAHEGFFYIRHEYPLAVRRVRAAIDACEKRGWLGEKLFGSDFTFRIGIKEGAGAFVCGEETALIASLEGQRGMPRLRPPFPAEAGLWKKPTLINNVETLAQVPWILRHGPEKFAAIGSARSKGTKVFSLAGKIRRSGLIEIPMGISIKP